MKQISGGAPTRFLEHNVQARMKRYAVILLSRVDKPNITTLLEPNAFMHFAVFVSVQVGWKVFMPVIMMSCEVYNHMSKRRVQRSRMFCVGKSVVVVKHHRKLGNTLFNNRVHHTQTKNSQVTTKKEHQVDIV